MSFAKILQDNPVDKEVIKGKSSEAGTLKLHQDKVLVQWHPKHKKFSDYLNKCRELKKQIGGIFNKELNGWLFTIKEVNAVVACFNDFENFIPDNDEVRELISNTESIEVFQTKGSIKCNGARLLLQWETRNKAEFDQFKNLAKELKEEYVEFGAKFRPSNPEFGSNDAGWVYPIDALETLKILFPTFKLINCPDIKRPIDLKREKMKELGKKLIEQKYNGQELFEHQKFAVEWLLSFKDR
jgi:hypothetical protein